LIIKLSSFLYKPNVYKKKLWLEITYELNVFDKKRNNKVNKVNKKR